MRRVFPMTTALTGMQPKSMHATRRASLWYRGWGVTPLRIAALVVGMTGTSRLCAAQRVPPQGVPQTPTRVIPPLPVLPAVEQTPTHTPGITDGDGRIHGAPVLPVSTLELRAGQVQSINLRPRQALIVEFPYAISTVHAGDPDVLTASVVASNVVILKAAKDSIAETNMFVLLERDDAMVIPFHVRVDSTQPQVDIIRCTDPIGQHLNATEASIARRLGADEDNRVDILAQERLEQQLLLAGGVVRIDRTARIGEGDQRLTLTVESAQSFPGEDGRERIYLRYRVTNGTVTPMSDLTLVAHVLKRQRRFLFFERQVERDRYAVQDIRAARVIPAGGSVYGLIILEPPHLSPHESLSLEGMVFNGQRHLQVDDVLVGNTHF